MMFKVESGSSDWILTPQNTEAIVEHENLITDNSEWQNIW